MQISDARLKEMGKLFYDMSRLETTPAYMKEKAEGWAKYIHGRLDEK